MGWFLLTACQLPEPSQLSGLRSDVVVSSPIDADEDGYAADVDCDDDDVIVHPDAEEVCLDGRDQSCIDGADACIWSGASDIEGLEIGRAERGTNIGSPLALCDLNADGHLDLVMAGPEVQNATGAVYVFRGPLEAKTLDDADYTLTGTGPWRVLGTSLDCGDVDGDDFADLVVNERGNEDAAAWGAAYVVTGESMESGPIDHVATTAWTGRYASELYGYDLAALDEDGNGLDEVAVTIWGTTGEATEEWGRTWVISDEPAPRDHAIDRVTADYVYGTGSEDWIVGSHDAGDLDGDGDDEVALVRRNSALDSLYIFHGPLHGALPTEAADLQITDTTQGIGHGVGHADLNADGYDDLFAGNPDSEPSAVYVFLDQEHASTADADVRIYCTYPSARAGWSVVSPGDVNADGEGDLLVGANGEDVVYLIGGGTPGVYDLDVDAQAVLRGNHVGGAVAAGEVTGDDITDFVITEYQLSGGGSGVIVMPSLDL